MASETTAEVSFYYIKEDDRPKKLQVACVLSEKAYKNKKSAYIFTTGDRDTNTVDTMLWDLRAWSFIPHVVSVEQTKPPSLIRIGNQLPQDEQYLLINLTDAMIDPHQKFKRIFEIATPMEKERARSRYEHYEEHNCVILEHNLR